MTQQRSALPRRVLLVDDHSMFTEALGAVLADQPGLEVVARVQTVAAARAEIALRHPHVVLLNITTDDGRGEDLMVSLTGGLDGTADGDRTGDGADGRPVPLVVVLTECEDPAVVARGLAAGVAAWMPKSEPVTAVVQAVAGLRHGDCYLPPRLLGPSIRALIASLEPQRVPAALAGLTDREREVLQCMVDGGTRAEVAARLRCSENTVRTHTQNLLAKLEAHSVVEAVATAMRLGMRPERARRPS